MKVIEIYGKEYPCSKCQKPVNYGGVEGSDGKPITKDGKPFNHVFGKGSNKISVAVNAGTTDIHPCYKDLTQQQVDEALAGNTKTPTVAATPGIINPSTPVQEFKDTTNSVYHQLEDLAAKLSGDGATAKDKHITTMALLHDYWSFRLVTK